MDLDTLAEENLAKLLSRQERNVLQGSGDTAAPLRVAAGPSRLLSAWRYFLNAASEVWAVWLGCPGYRAWYVADL